MNDESGSMLLNIVSAPSASGVHPEKRAPRVRTTMIQRREIKKKEKLRLKRRAKKHRMVDNRKARRAAEEAASAATNGGKDGKTSQPNGSKNRKKPAPLSTLPSALSKQSRNIPAYAKKLAATGNKDGKKTAPLATVTSVLKKPVLKKPKPNVPAFVTKPKKKSVKFVLEDSGKSGEGERTRTSVKRAGKSKVLPPSTPAAEGGGFASFLKKSGKGRVGVPLKVKLPEGGVAAFVPKKTSRGPLRKSQRTRAGGEEQPSVVETTSEGPKPQESDFGANMPKRGWPEASKDSGFEEEASEEERRPWKKQRGAAGQGGRPEGDARGRVTSLFGSNPQIPRLAQRAVKPLEERVFADEEFSDLPIHGFQVSNLRSLGLSRLTEVQRRAVPSLLEGRDALVRSQTGSGKTLAYALPLVELLQRRRPPLTRADGVRAVVVLPTRELALQTYEVFLKLVKPFMRLVPGILAGGEKRKAEKARLRKGISILVGTPGRLLDHVKSTRALRLGKVQFLVLDEADRLLDMGYEKDVSSLVAAIATQTAPMLPEEVLALSRSKTRKPKDDGFIKKELEVPNKITKFNSDSEDEVEPVEKKAKITKFEDDSDEEEEDEEGDGRKEDEVAEFKDEDEDIVESDEPKGKKKRWQTVLLSATLSPGVERLAGLTLHSHVYIDAADADAAAAEVVIPSALKQYYMIVPPKLRLVTLSAFIVAKCKMSQQRKILLFCGTQDMVDYLSALLSAGLGRGGDHDEAQTAGEGEASDSESGSDGEVDSQWAAELLAAATATAQREEGPAVDVEFFRLHGSMDQKERTHVFQTFREAKSGVLLCTDVAARGLDLPHVDWIVQWTAPCSVADYVHRVGRTARGGAQGYALLFLCPHEAPFLAMLQERRIRLQEERLERCLEKLAEAQGSLNHEAAATHLQTRFENAVLEHHNLHDMATRAYVSFVRFYASYPKDVREAFSFRALHLGHCAKSFAIRDPPSAIAGLRRRQHEREQQRLQRTGPGRESGAGATERARPKGMHGAKERARNAKARVRTRELVLSEFSSGLAPVKKRKTLG